MEMFCAGREKRVRTLGSESLIQEHFFGQVGASVFDMNCQFEDRGSQANGVFDPETSLKFETLLPFPPTVTARNWRLDFCISSIENNDVTEQKPSPLHFKTAHCCGLLCAGIEPDKLPHDQGGCSVSAIDDRQRDGEHQSRAASD